MPEANFRWLRFSGSIESKPEIDRLSDAAFRALARLWILSVECGPLPDDVRWLASKLRRRPRDVEAALNADFHREPDGKWVSDYVEGERATAAAYHRQRRDASQKAAQKRAQSSASTGAWPQAAEATGDEVL